MEKYIIAGFAGIGKTTLGESNPKDVLDMEIRPYKWKNYKSEYTLKQWYTMEHILNDDGWLNNYFDAIKEEIKEGNHKIIFVWCNIDVLNWLRDENIKHTIAYWDKDEEGMKDFLQQLYTKRGNPQYWIDSVINFLNVADEYAKLNKVNSIILNKNENIEMKLKEIKWLD